MRLSNILRLYRVRIRARLGQELFAVLGIAIGVSLLFASQVVDTSLNGSVERLANGIVGQMRFELAARDAHGFDESMLQRVAALPGVQAAAPVLQQNANLAGPRGAQSVDLIGIDPRLARFGGPIARHLSVVGIGNARVLTTPAPIAERIGVTTVRPVELQLGVERSTALLVPGVLARGGGALGASPIALAPLRTVQKLSRLRGRLTSIYVRSPARLDGVVRRELERLAAGRLDVRAANSTSLLFRRAAGPVDQSTGLFAALSALVGFLFAFNALLLTVPQRRALIHDLHLDGYTRRMIVEVLLLDALVLGVLASALGLLLGERLSVALFSSNPGYLSFAFPIGIERIVTLGSVVLAFAGGMLAAAIGVLAPLRAEIVERPAGFERDAPRGSRSGLLLGVAVACLAATTVILLAAPQSAIVGVLSLAFALLFCLPALLDLTVRWAARAQAMMNGAASFLALIELRSRPNRARSVAIAATGAIAVFGSVSIEGARGNLQRGLDASARGIDSRADIWVSPVGSANSLATTPFADRFGAVIARLPGVRRVESYRSSFLDWDARRAWVIAQPRADLRPIAASQIVSGDAALASARLRAGGWLVISRAIAEEHQLHIGQSFTFPSPQPRTFRVAALSTNLGWPPGAVILNADDYALAWGNRDLSAYQVGIAAAASPTAVSAEIERALGPHSGLRVETMSQRERLHYGTASQGLSRLTEIRTLVLIAAVLAMAAAMGAMIWQRRLRLAEMKVDGFSRLVLWRALLWESVVLLGLGCALGAAFGAYGQLLLSRALSAVTGFPVIESSPLGVVIGSFGLITAVAVAVAAIPGYLAARVRPTIAMPE
jgi:putative ABC transport system permease protein